MLVQPRAHGHVGILAHDAPAGWVDAARAHEVLERAGQAKLNLLVIHVVLLNFTAELLDERHDQVLHQVFRSTRTGGHKHRADAREPLGSKLALVVHQPRGRSHILADLSEANAVAAVAAAVYGVYRFFTPDYLEDFEDDFEDDYDDDDFFEDEDDEEEPAKPEEKKEEE